MNSIQEWLVQAPKWSVQHVHLLTIPNDKPSVIVEDVLLNSDQFNIAFPVETVRNKTLLNTVSYYMLDRNVQSAYPIIHEAILYLCAEFLLFKIDNGSSYERELYSCMSILEFIQRLLTKRAVMFLGQNDYYILRNGTENTSGESDWKLIGTSKQKYPLILKDYLSYDELKISTFLSTSSYSYFINKGSRLNEGKPDIFREDIEEEGIIIGLAGTRLNKPDVMEFQEIVITQKQNTVSNGYGDYNLTSLHSIFASFYETSSFLYDIVRYFTIDNATRFEDLQNGYFFDNEVYAKRLAISFDTLLLEANHRAKERGKYAYIHLVGFGLGNFKISDHQEYIFVNTFGSRIRSLGENLKHVSDIHFSYFGRTINCCGYKNNELFPISNHPKGGVKILISERDPFTKLNNSEKLLVVSYASDANALPGNEFWNGCIQNSSNSATAASSQISENHNPFINPNICADNLMVATNTELISVYDYYKKVCKKLTK